MDSQEAEMKVPDTHQEKDQGCERSPEEDPKNEDSRTSDDDEVAKFDGKIVYNPDGSAYIIEDGDLSEEETLKLPRQEGSIIEKTGEDATTNNNASYPPIANAFYVSKSSAYFNALYGQAYVKMLQEKNVPETPVVHSYRVYTARDKSGNEEDRAPQDPKQLPAVPIVVPVKPILMCFICKLSFGCPKLFSTHCVDSHHLELTTEENEILNQKNTSAIIQNVGKEQETRVSFLEPVTSGPTTKSPPVSPGAITNLLAVAAAAAASSKNSNKDGGDMGPPARLLQQIQQNLGAEAEGQLKLPLSSPANVRSTSPLEAGRSNSVSPAGTRLSSPSPSVTSNTSSFAPLPPPSVVPTPTNANMLQGTTIGACPEHINGRPTGVECVKCDLIISSSRMAGGSNWNLSRNSCKTLKCPKCNWHYKYQETLEIHMKEKHPESETTCIYCITGQQHPRLARGETYTCGYKPYRCEVCNYSTTTKGNLSIHMQSDKHLNNMQEIQNSGQPGSTTDKAQVPSTSRSGSSLSQSLPPSSLVSPMKQPPTSSISSQLPPSPQQSKPNWRCDVCNYETNVARNLRIHMTSEKHTHNMMALQQQNVKNMQNLSALQMASGLPNLPGNPNLDPKQLLGMLSGALPPSSSASGQAGPEAAMADLAFNQAVLAQLMGGAGGLPKPHAGLPNMPPEFNLAAALAAATGMPGLPGLQNVPEDPQEPPPEPTDQNPKFLFTCCVCRIFNCDNLDDLSSHLAEDRSHTRENEVSIVIAGNYLCQLCNYKTNLKANFQLHCKTDKHLQRLSHVNHIKEGGPANEWKLRFITSINPVELRCNSCEFYSNSPHKLQVHAGGQQHQVSALLFSHLQNMESSYGSDVSENQLSYECALCKFSAKGKHGLLAHVRTMQHLQMEQIHQLQKRAEGNTAHTEIGDIFQVNLDKNCQEEDVKAKRDGKHSCFFNAGHVFFALEKTNCKLI